MSSLPLLQLGRSLYPCLLIIVHVMMMIVMMMIVMMMIVMMMIICARDDGPAFAVWWCSHHVLRSTVQCAL